MANDEVIDQEIEDPVKYEVSTTARGITEELFRNPFGKRTVEKINDFCYYLCEFIHIQTPLRLQRYNKKMIYARKIGFYVKKFGELRKKQYLCTEFNS